MVVRAIAGKKVTVELHEDVHPHPPHMMWVTVTSVSGEVYGNIYVR